MSLKSLYLDGSSGLTAKLNDAFELGRRFILPQYDDLALPDAANISATGTQFSIQNSPTVQAINAGYTVRFTTNGVEREIIVASSPAPTAGAFNATVSPWVVPFSIDSFVHLSGTTVRINVVSSTGGVIAGDSVVVAGSAVSANNGTWLVTAVGTNSYMDVTIAGSSASNDEDPSSATVTNVVVTNKMLRYSSPRPSSYSTIVNELTAAAAAGKTKFCFSVETVDNPAYLRLNGNYLQAYLSGIYYALAQEQIFTTYEAKLCLDVTDCLSTKIKFNFNFGTFDFSSNCACPVTSCTCK